MIQEIYESLSCWQLKCMPLLCRTSAIVSHTPFWSCSEGGWEERCDERHFPVVSTAGQARYIARFTLTLLFCVLGPMLNSPLEEKLESNRLEVFSCFKFQLLLGGGDIFGQ